MTAAIRDTMSEGDTILTPAPLHTASVRARWFLFSCQTAALDVSKGHCFCIM